MNSEVFLVTNDEKGAVAIGHSIIKYGVFELNGEVPGVTIAYLVPKERNAVWATLFLSENGEYTISTDAGGSLTVNGGGKHQEIFEEFGAINKAVVKVKQQYDLKVKSISDPKQLEALKGILSEAALKAQANQIELFKKYNDSFVSAYVIASTMLGVDDKNLKECYGLLGANAKSSLYGKQISAYLSRLENITMGATASDFSAPLADGGTIKLDEVNAKVKIVYFWASWSDPSREENVNMLKLYKQYRPKGLEIIGVSLDNNRQVWLNAIGEDGSTWKNIIDGKNEISSLYCVSSIPCLFVLDENNKIIATNIFGENLKAKVDEILRKK